MKKTLIYLFILISSFTLDCYAQISNITPFIYDLKGVESSGDTVVVFGSLGSGMISFDKGREWKNLQPYKNEDIISIYIKNKKLISFSESGIIKESNDWGNNWDEISSINDTIISINYFNEYYYLLTKDKILLLDDKYQILNSQNLRKSLNVNTLNIPKMEPMLTFYRNQVIALDSGQIVKFDLNLNLIDTLILPNNLSCYRLYSTSNELFAQSYPFLYKIKDFSNPVPFLNTVQKNIDLFDSNDYWIFYMKVINDKLYSFNPFTENKRYPYLHYYQIIDSNEAILKGTIDFSQEKASGFFKQRLMDLKPVGDNFFLVSDKNLLVNYNTNTNKTQIISNLYEFNSTGDYIPIRVNDSLSFYQVGNKFFKMNMNSFKWTRLISDSIVNSNINNTIKFRKYDNYTNQLTYIIESYNEGKKSILYESKDLGNSFTKHELTNLILSQAISILDINYTDKNIYVTINYKTSNLTNVILEYDKDYKYVKQTLDSNYEYKKVKYLNDKKIIRITSDLGSDLTNKISSSGDGGNSWKEIKEYGFSKPDTTIFDDGSKFITSYPNYLTTYDIEINNVPYWLNAIYTRDKSLFEFELINLETFESKIIFEISLPPDNGISFAYDNYKDTTILVVNDNIYLIKDLLNFNDRKEYKLPDNGRITAGRFKRFEKRYYASYFDDKHSLNLYWINFDGNGITSVDSFNKTELSSYFYNSPPYPQPTSSLVTTKVYLDQAVTLSKSSIKIFDVNGTQVEKGDNVEISGTNWPTTLTWDSSNQPSGVYFIVLNYSGNSKAIKVMKR